MQFDKKHNRIITKLSYFNLSWWASDQMIAGMEPPTLFRERTVFELTFLLLTGMQVMLTYYACQLAQVCGILGWMSLSDISDDILTVSCWSLLIYWDHQITFVTTQYSTYRLIHVFRTKLTIFIYFLFYTKHSIHFHIFRVASFNCAYIQFEHCYQK